MDYANKMDIILKAVGVRTIDEVADDSRIRKSRSDLPRTQRTSLSRQRSRLRSKSDSSLRFICNVPPIVESCMCRDRSQSLDSAISRSSTNSAFHLNPTGLETPDSRLSPLMFTKSNPSLSTSREDVPQSVDLVVPETWDWNAWEDK